MDQLPGALQTALFAGGGIVVGLLVVIWVIKQFMYICPPNFALIFSGRNHTTADGRTVGFRVILGGRGLRIPVVETAQYMDVSLISVPMSVQGAYSEGGIPLNVHAVANVKVNSDDRFIGNAIERFLGKPRAEIARVAKETLEGHLRGVLAQMTPREVNEDRLKFAGQLQAEATADLEKLGLQLDTLKIQHVSDDRNYLESIGRERIAEILRAAEVAESDAEREAKETEADARARGEVALTKAKTTIARKENELRQIKADLEANARSEEERTVAAASAARANAEKELQEVRGRLEELRLAADVTIPADIDRQVRELIAEGRAAPIAENGRAMAAALEAVAEAWRETQGKAMDMYVFQNLEEIFQHVADAARKTNVKEVNLVDGGDGSTLPAYVGSYPATVSRLLDEIASSIGVDIRQVVTGDTTGPATQTPAQ